MARATLDLETPYNRDDASIPLVLSSSLHKVRRLALPNRNRIG